MSSHRLPLWTRVAHPRLAADATSLARDLLRTADTALPPDRRTPLELEQEARDRAHADRRTRGVQRRLVRLSAAGQRRAQRSRGLVARVSAGDDELVRAADLVVPVGRLRALAARVDHPEAAPSDRAGPWLWGAVTAAQAAVLAFALTVLLDLGAGRAAVAVLVAAPAVAVPALLARHLGRRVAARRDAAARDDLAEDLPPVLPLAAAVVVLTLPSAVAVVLAARQVAAGAAGTVVGLVLAAAALGAPWCGVTRGADGPARSRRAAAGVLLRADRRRRRRLRRARRLLDAAVRDRSRAACLLAATRHAHGHDYLRGQRVTLLARSLAGDIRAYSAADLRPLSPTAPVALLPVLGAADDACLRLPVEHLDAAIAGADAAYATVSAMSRGDVDLAG